MVHQEKEKNTQIYILKMIEHSLCQIQLRKMRLIFPHASVLILLLLQVTLSFGQKTEPTIGPVFIDVGAVYSIENLDHLPDTSQHLQAIFDVDRKQTDPSRSNPIISSLNRYYNMHVRYGLRKENIHLVAVLHGSSTKDALSNSAYKEKYNVDNPNKELIESLSEMGVKVYLCGQSMSYSGYSKEDLHPDVKVALSAMTVLTIYQMDNYALIKF